MMNDENRFSDKRIIKIGISVLAIIVVITPVILFFLVDQASFCNNTIKSDTWLAFWGTYVGACIGAAASFLVYYGTISHYQKVFKSEMKKYYDEKKEQNRRYKFELDRRLLIEARPYLSAEEIEEKNVTKVIEIDRYVYRQSELDDDIQRVFMSRVDGFSKEVFIRIKNTGVGNAENINFQHKAADYCVGSFDDNLIKTKGDNTSKIYFKESFDIAHGEFVDVKLRLFYTKSLKDTICENNITISLLGCDVRNNKIEREICLDFQRNKIGAIDTQKYKDQYMQSIYDGELEDIL